MKKYLGALLLPLGLLAHGDGDGDFTQFQLRYGINKVIDAASLTLGQGYAPRFWKGELLDWHLDEAAMDAKLKAWQGDDMTLREGQQVIKDFFDSMKDYHVSVRFLSTEAAWLPFDVTGAEQRYFVTWVNRDKMGERPWRFEVGDEILEFDGKPVHEVIAQIAARELGGTNGRTNMGLAEYLLTIRLGRLGMEVPHGGVVIKYRSKATGDVREYQLGWNYLPEQFTQTKPVEESFRAKFAKGDVDEIDYYKDVDAFRSLLSEVFNQQMTLPTASAITEMQRIKTQSKGSSPYWLGAKKSVLPRLGGTWWEHEGDYFQAYTFADCNGHKVGFIRIPSYWGRNLDAMAEEFAEIIDRFEQEVDAVVIDQMYNPGGAVMYQYGLGSMLTNTAMKTPQHRMAISRLDSAMAGYLLGLLDYWMNNEDDVRNILGKEWYGYPTSYSLVEMWKANCRFIMSEWEGGHTLTDYGWLSGIDQINPNHRHNLTKPILFLTNHLDFSGGDFFPAILQDAGRVRVMGTRTAGAGGCVGMDWFPTNHTGAAAFSYTWTFAMRANGEPIENLGITPDVEYEITAEDMENNYAPFVERIREEVNRLIHDSV